MSAAADHSDMSDDLTVLRLDVDADAVRALLESIPGLSPAELPEIEPERESDRTDSDPSPPRERTGPRVGETPAPGVGDEYDPAKDSDDGHSTLLIAGAVGAVLAVVAAVGAVLYRRRSSDGTSLSAPDVGGIGVPDVDVGPFGGDDPADEPVETERSPSTIDRAPLIGMVALAVGGVVVRAVRSGERSAEAGD
jgi:hypothetical protein